ncbi:MAG: radical SAM protein [Candidatus Omnitrophota bacterium]
MSNKQTKLKAVLVQLPFPEFKLKKQWGNVPLACGYLKAVCLQKGLLENADIEILDAQNSNMSGDARLAEILAARRPDILGFSLYCWNSMRSLYIAGEVKKRLPGLKVIVGGPEVSTDAKYIMDNQAVDIGCFGEGEWTFAELLEQMLDPKGNIENIKGIFYRRAGKTIFTPPRSETVEIADIPSPYLLGMINPKAYGVMWIETQRGCPFHCTYCGEGGRSARLFPAEMIEQELALAVELGIKKIVFLDSALNLSPHFTRFLRFIKGINKERKLTLGAAVYAESLTETTAAMFKECGVWALDIGLQTIDPLVLRNIGRHLDQEKFLSGITALRKNGLSFSISLMAGLPGQTLTSFQQTMTFLRQNELTASVDIFPTRVLPGTRLRREKGKYGIECLDAPPYLVRRTDTFSEEEIKECVESCKQFEDDFKLESPLTAYLNTGYPDINNSSLRFLADTDISAVGYPITKIIIELGANQQNCDGLRLLGQRLSKQTGTPLAVWFKSENIDEDAAPVNSFLNGISSANPHLTWNIFLETAKEFELPLLNKIKKAAAGANHFLLKPVRIFAIFPFEGHKLSANWLREVSNVLFFYWYVKFNQKNNWQKEIENVFRDEHRSFLVDFSADSGIDFIVKLLKIFRDNDKNKEFLFKNYAIIRLMGQDYHLQEKQARIGEDTEECVLQFNKEIKLTSGIFPDMESKIEKRIFQYKLLKEAFKASRNEDTILS